MRRRILWTFGTDTKYKGKCVITVSEDYRVAREYVYNAYGRENVASNYIEPFEDIDDIIKKYNYEIIEDIAIYT